MFGFKFNFLNCNFGTSSLNFKPTILSNLGVAQWKKNYNWKKIDLFNFIYYCKIPIKETYRD